MATYEEFLGQLFQPDERSVEMRKVAASLDEMSDVELLEMAEELGLHKEAAPPTPLGIQEFMRGESQSRSQLRAGPKRPEAPATNAAWQQWQARNARRHSMEKERDTAFQQEQAVRKFRQRQQATPTRRLDFSDSPMVVEGRRPAGKAIPTQQYNMPPMTITGRRPGVATQPAARPVPRQQPRGEVAFRPGPSPATNATVADHARDALRLSPNSAFRPAVEKPRPFNSLAELRAAAAAAGRPVQPSPVKSTISALAPGVRTGKVPDWARQSLTAPPPPTAAVQAPGGLKSLNEKRSADIGALRELLKQAARPPRLGLPGNAALMRRFRQMGKVRKQPFSFV